MPPVSTVNDTLAAAGLADKPEWQQALATFDALSGNQQSVEQAMPEAQRQGKPREVTPELAPSGDGGDDSYAGVPANVALGPAMDRAYYEPAQVDARYRQRLESAAAQGEAERAAAMAQAEAERAAQAEPFPQTMGGPETFVAEPTPEAQPPAPKVLSKQEQAKVNTLTKRIDNLTKLLAVEKNPAARARVEETRAGYEFELRNITGETAAVLTPEEQARAGAVRQEQSPGQPALPPGQGFNLIGEPYAGDVNSGSMRSDAGQVQAGGLGDGRFPGQGGGDLQQPASEGTGGAELGRGQEGQGQPQPLTAAGAEATTVPIQEPGQQYSLGSEAAPRPHTTEDVAKAFPTGTVTETPDGHSVALPNGETIRVNRVGEIALDEGAAQAGGYSPEETTGARPVASFKRKRPKRSFLRCLNFLPWFIPQEDDHGSTSNRSAFLEGDVLVGACCSLAAWRSEPGCILSAAWPFPEFPELLAQAFRRNE